MGIPLEVRSNILGFLLPNLSEIKVFDGYYDGFNPVGTYPEESKKDDEAITQRVASMVRYRDDDEKCHTAILRVGRQFYTDGTAIMYNRAFRAVITARGITFLKSRFTSAKERCNSEVILEPGDLQYFPFHLAKQIQIEFWATHFEAQDAYLYSALLEFCLVLSDKPSLRNVRVDLYDRTYRPKPTLNFQDRKADGNGPYPPQDMFQGEVLNETFQRTEEEIEFWGDVKRRDYNDEDAASWERAAGRELIFWRYRSDDGRPRPRGLEEALEPLKLLANIGRARINLTPEVGKHQEMLADSKRLENSMVHEGLRCEIQLVCPRCRLCSLSQVHTCQVRSRSVQ